MDSFISIQFQEFKKHSQFHSVAHNPGLWLFIIVTWRAASLFMYTHAMLKLGHKILQNYHQPTNKKQNKAPGTTLLLV